MFTLLITPPLTQINTPYPATAYLKGFILSKPELGNCEQVDLGLELVLEIFTPSFLEIIFKEASKKKLSATGKRTLSLQDEYIATVQYVIGFLQGKNPSLAHAIVNQNFLPQGDRFNETANEQADLFGEAAIQDKAKFYATLYLNDLGDFITEYISPFFGFSRYAESLGRVATSFEPLENAILQSNNCIDKLMLSILDKHLKNYQPNLVGFTVPFPGNLYAAFLCANVIKTNYPHIYTMMGGGFPNTELRSLKEPNVFKYFNFITLDDGERPFECLIEFIENKRTLAQLKRTFTLQNQEVVYLDGATEPDYGHVQNATPNYTGLKLNEYISVLEMINPMHRLWNDNRWNKLTLAHGCYWKKCTFCDVTLDYIGRYEPASAQLIVNQIEEIILQTGTTGFHFVDEAAPPLLMRDLAIELIKRKIKITWWTNIRFEKTFTHDLCRLLSLSGCVAVTGGIEVASDRLLALMEKGVTIEQVTKVTDAFTTSGILVHAYLMYGFPSQTEQETIDSLEIVRQLFENNLIQSAFWHRFALTWHSPVGKNPEKYGLTITGPAEGNFANNDLYFVDAKGAQHDKFSDGLKKSLFNYMHGNCLNWPINKWFPFKTSKTTHHKSLIEKYLSNIQIDNNPSQKIIWVGIAPTINSKNTLFIHTLIEKDNIQLSIEEINFIEQLYQLANIKSNNWPTLQEVTSLYQQLTKNNLFQSELWEIICASYIVIIKI